VWPSASSANQSVKNTIVLYKEPYTAKKPEFFYIMNLSIIILVKEKDITLYLNNIVIIQSMEKRGFIQIS